MGVGVGVEERRQVLIMQIYCGPMQACWAVFSKSLPKLEGWVVGLPQLKTQGEGDRPLHQSTAGRHPPLDTGDTKVSSSFLGWQLLRFGCSFPLCR